jgi:hypothetical protein
MLILTSICAFPSEHFTHKAYKHTSVNFELGENVARITITLNDELDKKLRETVADTIGFKKGNLQIAIEEAIEAWVKMRKDQKKDRK